LFDEVDADGSGAIDVEEMGVLLRKLGRQMTDAEVEAAFAEVDDDCSGEIEFFEFECDIADTDLLSLACAALDPFEQGCSFTLSRS
jgi:Ca2+-binding EF-hand superfamily protein